MKKSVSLLLSALISISATCAYAKETACPSVWVIRSLGSNFTHAFKPAGKTQMWVLSSDPFEFGDAYWQTHYFAKMDEAKGPMDALSIGQNDYDHSTLVTEPVESQFGTAIQCAYAPEDASYYVLAMNQVNAGFQAVHLKK